MDDLGMPAHAAREPDRPALVEGDRELTYGELAGRAERLAASFAGLGVERGEAVAAMLPNGFEIFEVAAAATRVEARFLPVNWHLKGEELAWILQDSGAPVLVASGAMAEAVDRARQGAPGCRVLLLEDEGPDGYQAALQADRPPPEAAGWSAPAFTFYTSGTTGKPKGVVHHGLDAGRMHAAQQGLMQLWGFTADDVHLLAGPAYHAGPGGYAFTTLFAGGTVAVMPQWDARAFLAGVERHRVTTTFLTPAHFIRILEVPDEERGAADLSSLRLVIHAGAPCPLAVKERILDALGGAEVWELYGMSEGGATRISPAEWRERPGSVGLPWPGTEVRILDEDGTPLPPGAVGLIHVAPPGGPSFEYHRDPEKTARAWRDGAFTVGDLGHMDEDGYLYVDDRAADLVLRDAVNIYPREVEEALHAHPAVVDCAVFGVPDERHGEVLKAVVETRSPVTPVALQEHCRSLLADFKCPETVELVDTLPRDPNGKVLKRHLRAAAAP